MVKIFTFTVELSGKGETPEEAWENACEAFELDPGVTPEDYEEEEIES